MNSNSEFSSFEDVSSQMLSAARSTFLPLSKQPSRMRQTTPTTIEVWGDDLREHYLLTYSPHHRNLVDVIFLEETRLHFF